MRGVYLAHLTQLVEFYFVKREISKQGMETVKNKLNLADDPKVCIILHFLFTFEELYYGKHFILNSKIWLMHSIWYKKKLRADLYKEIQSQV